MATYFYRFRIIRRQLKTSIVMVAHKGVVVVSFRHPIFGGKQPSDAAAECWFRGRVRRRGCVWRPSLNEASWPAASFSRPGARWKGEPLQRSRKIQETLQWWHLMAGLHLLSIPPAQSEIGSSVWGTLWEMNIHGYPQLRLGFGRHVTPWPPWPPWLLNDHDNELLLAGLGANALDAANP